MSATRPYKNVRASAWKENRWEAVHPLGGGRSRHLGTFDTPEQARYAVLIAQANRFEEKAAEYRFEAAALIEASDGPQ